MLLVGQGHLALVLWGQLSSGTKPLGHRKLMDPLLVACTLLCHLWIPNTGVTVMDPVFGINFYWDWGEGGGINMQCRHHGRWHDWLSRFIDQKMNQHVIR
jgi:hypothetical protein